MKNKVITRRLKTSRKKLAVTSGLLLVVLLAVSLGGCGAAADFDSRLNSIVLPYRFSILDWEFNALFGLGEPAGSAEEIADEPQQVLLYFDLLWEINNLRAEIDAVSNGSKPGDLAALEAGLEQLQARRQGMENAVERIIEKQVAEALAELGISAHLLDSYLNLPVDFPPVDFALEQPPNLLIVSPRDRIDSIREVPLIQELSPEDRERIEAGVDELGVSSLVEELGGFGGTYPTFITNNAGLRFTINAVAEEWLHQYLTFRPLGFRYLLDQTGVRRDYDIATINETVAGIVSKEIGALVCDKHYPQYGDSNDDSQPAAPVFDFNQEMREIRVAVDEYLARGEIELAEEFMEEKRRYLLTQGYYIRKLNQAYFAFYGTYADSPTSINPIGDEFRLLRSQSVSLKDFLDTAAEMTSRQDLTDSIK
ncbi:hypothetical protein ACFLS8_05470 [Chloroflexota bacterium]